jgi:hypothetical protein
MKTPISNEEDLVIFNKKVKSLNKELEILNDQLEDGETNQKNIEIKIENIGTKFFTDDDIQRSQIYVKWIVRDVIEARKLMETSDLSQKKKLADKICVLLDDLEKVGCYMGDFDSPTVEYPTLFGLKKVTFTYD